MASKRLFVAIPIPKEIRRKLFDLQHKFSDPAIRWTACENLHITVHFIGGVETERIDTVIEQIKNVTLRSKSFVLKSNGLKLIKKNRKPAMIWVAFEPNDHFVKMSMMIREVLSGDHSKNPLPHITLARIKSNKQKCQFTIDLPKLFNFKLNVDAIELWESDLSDGYPVYTNLKTFNLIQ